MSDDNTLPSFREMMDFKKSGGKTPDTKEGWCSFLKSTDDEQNNTTPIKKAGEFPENFTETLRNQWLKQASDARAAGNMDAAKHYGELAGSYQYIIDGGDDHVVFRDANGNWVESMSGDAEDGATYSGTSIGTPPRAIPGSINDAAIVAKIEALQAEIEKLQAARDPRVRKSLLKAAIAKAAAKEKPVDARGRPMSEEDVAAGKKDYYGYAKSADAIVKSAMDMTPEQLEEFQAFFKSASAAVEAVGQIKKATQNK